MSTTEAGVAVIALMAFVSIVAFLRFQKRAKVKIKGLGRTGLDIDASNEPGPAIRAEGVTSHGGGLFAKDTTGHGVDVKSVDVAKDVTLTSGPNGPKA